MALSAAKLGRQKGLNQVPGHRWSHGSTAHADHVHVIVFHTLSRREVVMNQPRADTENFVGANRGADAAATDGYATLHPSLRYGMRQRCDEVRIVVVTPLAHAVAEG